MEILTYFHYSNITYPSLYQVIENNLYMRSIENYRKYKARTEIWAILRLHSKNSGIFYPDQSILILNGSVCRALKII